MSCKEFWLITYYGGDYFGEEATKMSPGEWRIDAMKFNDGPYLIINAERLSQEEFDQLEGNIG